MMPSVMSAFEQILIEADGAEASALDAARCAAAGVFDASDVDPMVAAYCWFELDRSDMLAQEPRMSARHCDAGALWMDAHAAACAQLEAAGVPGEVNLRIRDRGALDRALPQIAAQVRAAFGAG